MNENRDLNEVKKELNLSLKNPSFWSTKIKALRNQPYLRDVSYDVDRALILEIFKSGTKHEHSLLRAKYYIEELGSIWNSPIGNRPFIPFQTNSLFAAVEVGNTCLIEYLLEKGVDHQIKFDGQSLLDFAKEKNRPEIVEILEKLDF